MEQKKLSEKKGTELPETRFAHEQWGKDSKAVVSNDLFNEPNEENLSVIDGEIDVSPMEHDGVNLNIHPSDDQFSDGSNSEDDHDQDKSQDRGSEASASFRELEHSQPETAYERLRRKVEGKRKRESKENADSSDDELSVEQMIEQMVWERFKKEKGKLKQTKRRRKVIESDWSSNFLESEPESRSRSRSKDQKHKSKSNQDQVKSPSDTMLYTPALKKRFANKKCY